MSNKQTGAGGWKEGRKEGELVVEAGGVVVGRVVLLWEASGGGSSSRIA